MEKGHFYFLSQEYFQDFPDKYQRIYDSKMKKNKRCDTIVFGSVLGHKKAFLIQNMCPAIPKYINSEYIDSKSKSAVRISGNLEKELISKAKHVLMLQRQGKKLIFPDVLAIEASLVNELHSQ